MLRMSGGRMLVKMLMRLLEHYEEEEEIESTQHQLDCNDIKSIPNDVIHDSRDVIAHENQIIHFHLNTTMTHLLKWK